MPAIAPLFSLLAMPGTLTIFGSAALGSLGSLLLRSVAAGALSMLAQKLAPKPRAPGIQTDVTTSGGTEYQKFVVGKFATAGHLVAPPYSHTESGVPNEFLTYIIEVSNIAGVGLSRVIIDGNYSDIGATAHADYGFPLLGQTKDGTDNAWVKFYDGNQTIADPMLVEKYGAHSERPWTAANVGAGIAYAIMTFRYNRDVFNNLPKVTFELDGIPLYDPRKDTTVGGSGAHRWDDLSTWEVSRNPILMIYNIMRGLPLPGGEIFGGEVLWLDLPFSNWIAGMNACESVIAGAAGNRPQFEAGLEISVGDEPAGVIEELLKTCLGQITERGGEFRVRVGAPAAPVYFLTDEDIVISDKRDLKPFPGLEATFNGITASYAEPNSLWKGSDAPALYNAAWETEDGGRRRAATMSVPACSNLAQVQQVMQAYINDERRLIVHTMVLPPDAIALDPLDTISWTSEENGYTSKIFEIVSRVSRPGTLLQEFVIRERDPSDYSWDGSIELPSPAPSVDVVIPSTATVPGFTVAAASVPDSAGQGRLPAIQIAWTPAEIASLAIQWEIRLQSSGVVVDANSTHNIAAAGVLISSGILPSTAYQVSVKLVTDLPSDWATWINVTTLDIRPILADLDPSVTAAIDAAAGSAAADVMAAVAARQGSEAARDLSQAARDAGIAARDIAVDAQGEATAIEGRLTTVETDINGTASTVADYSDQAAEASNTALAAAGGNLIHDPTMTVSDISTWPSSSGGVLSFVTHGQAGPVNPIALRSADPADAVAGFYSAMVENADWIGRRINLSGQFRSENGGSSNIGVAYYADGVYIYTVWQTLAATTSFQPFDFMVEIPVNANGIRFRQWTTGSAAGDWSEFTDLFMRDITESNISEGHSAVARNAETDAVQALSDTNDAKAIAISARDTAVQVSSQGSGVLSDQFMSSSWANYGTGPTVSDNEIYSSGNTFTFSDTAADSRGSSISSLSSLWIGATDLDYFRVEVDFELISGDLNGAGILFDWRDTL